MAVLPADSSFLGLVSCHVGIWFAFASGLFNFLRVVGKAVMRFLSFSHGQSPLSKNLSPSLDQHG
jgi:hypothetical protein